MTSVLVVDDDRTVRETLSGFFTTLGLAARTAATASEGRAAAAAHAPDIALVDLRLPDGSGLTLLEALRADDPELGVIMLTGHSDVPTAVRAMQAGAVDFLEKPVDLEALDAAVTRVAELVRLRREVSVLRAQRSSNSATGREPSLQRLLDLVAANDDAPVLIVGEAGAGKGHLARRIHDRSARAAQPFIEVNGAAPSAASLESVLFGHERGAFAEATFAKRGLLEVAGSGTLFLDDIGALPLDVQPKLLELLSARTFRRLGGTVELRSYARVIAATSQLLADLTRDGRFRADLFRRLQVVTLALPALRQRRSELSGLATALLPRGARLSPNAQAALHLHSWPGNVRELENTLWRAALLAKDAPIDVKHLGLPRAIARAPRSRVTLAEAEWRTIADALRTTNGNKVQASRLLGVARSTLMEKLKRLGLD